MTTSLKGAAAPSNGVTPPPPLSPSRRTAVRALLIVIATALIAGVVVTLSAAAWGVSTFRVVKDSMALPSTLTGVTIDTGSVPVAVRITTDREVREPRVDMRMVNSSDAGSHPLEVNADGTTARVTIDTESSEFLRWGRAGEITLVLPPEVARRVSVTTQQEMGVVFAQADIDQLIARTLDGAVMLSGSARRIEITNEHGDVITREPIAVSDSFRATTTTGDVSVDFAEAPPTVDAESQHGDVVISLPPPGPYFVDATTAMEHGTTVVRVPQTNDRDGAAAVITGRSETGDVVIEDLEN